MMNFDKLAHKLACDVCQVTELPDNQAVPEMDPDLKARYARLSRELDEKIEAAKAAYNAAQQRLGVLGDLYSEMEEARYNKDANLLAAMNKVERSLDDIELVGGM